ncbi:MAG: sulfatase-like hydrolase/transferase [Thermoanaerobaculia bacterium]
MLTLDTTRADHTSLYNYSLNNTPFLQEILKEGIIFENCYSPVPLTLPAHISLFTGKEPFEHKIFLNGQFYKAEKDYLPLLFKEKKYNTYAFLSSSILDRVFGMGVGFDYYEDKINSERKCEETLKVFKEKLKELKEPFFLWVHFFDPHSPYTPPEDYRKKFQNPYDGEIAYMDSCIRELFKVLPENTTTLIIGDHGELLGEHNEMEHGVLLYEGAIKVPCLLINGEIKNKSYQKPVSFKEIYKILNSYFFEGKNIKDILEDLKEEPIVSSSLYGREVFGFEPSRVLIWKDFKLILYGEKNYKLFNLKLDREEKMNLAEKEREKAGELLKVLRNYKFPEKVSSFPEESEKILKSLGYLMPSPRKDLKDPEKGVLAEKKVKEAVERMQYRDFKRAEEILKEVLLDFPEHGEALSAMGKLYLSQGKNREGLQIFKKLLSLRAGDVITNLRYAQALIANDKIEEAEKILRNCIEIHPRLTEAYGELSKIYILKGMREDLLKLHKKAEENEVEDFFLLYEVAKIKEEEKKYEESFLLYHRSYKLNPTSPEVLLALGRVSVKKGQVKVAINYYRQLLKIYPSHCQGNYFLGVLIYLNDNKREEALNYLYKALNFCSDFDFINKIKEKIEKIERGEKINQEEVL